jgi:UDPglucose--hexose-1-phosphate uridylyltransferase
MSVARPASLKRMHPYLKEWVILAPATDVRPWNGAVLRAAEAAGPAFDPECHLCPGAKRSTGAVNPPYAGAYAFDNDFASLTLDSPARGVCRVVCFDPRHNATLADMPAAAIEGVLRALAEQYRELASVPGMEYVMVFENKGKEIGVSNPHPHGQIYATDFVPRIPAAMYASAAEFRSGRGGCLFCDVLAGELRDGARIVARNAHFAAFVPSFARFKYEVHLMPLRHVPRMDALDAAETAALAELYREVLIRYDNLFARRIPNITVFYNAPCKAGLDPEPWHFHIQFAPPVRAADKLKYLAGFETGGGNIINPSLPEASAEELRRAGAERPAGVPA